MHPVYLDAHATTPVDRRVLEAMLPFFTETFGNPASSSHAWGWRAQEAVEAARRDVAALIGASAREIIFTGGATESNNFAIAGLAAKAPADRRHIVTSAIEHKSVLEAARRLEREGWRVSIAPIGRDGRVDLTKFEALVTPDTAIVSIMAANNEIGTVQPLAEIARIAHDKGALFHTDAAQAAGRIAIDVNAMGVDALSLTGHKMYGPKGEGALFLRKKIDIAPFIVGGGHERGLRSGTLNVPGIVGLAKACAICHAEMAEESARLSGLRDRLLAGLRARVPNVVVNGSMEYRLPNNLHVSFPGVDGESLMISIGDIAVSAGSACAAGSATPSHVMHALVGEDGVPAATVRFGLTRSTTAEEIDYAVAKFAAAAVHLGRPPG